MGLTPVADRLADLVDLERQLGELFNELATATSGDPRAESMLRSLSSTATDHGRRLQGRLQELGVNLAPRRPSLIDVPRPSRATTTLGAVHAASTSLNHVVVAYAILHIVAHRFFDSTGEGNTADLAEEHLRAYTGAAQQINQILSDTVVIELGLEGHECRCQCPSCALGICLCSPHGTSTVVQAWRETSPGPAGPGIEVRPVRQDSPAAQAGLGTGDRVVAADANEIEDETNLGVMQETIRSHSSGEPIELDVVRADKKTTVIVSCP